MRTITPVLFLIFTAASVFAQTEVSGIQSGTWTIDESPYLVVGDILVQNGDSLVIDPGILVEFQGYFRFTVEGVLVAGGTVADSIVFTNSDTSSWWHGLRFETADPGGGLSYCRFQGGKATGDWPDNCGGGVSLWESEVNIENCLFTDNSADNLGGGLFCWSSSSTVSGCEFQGNSCGFYGGAVHLYFSSPRIEECRFYDNVASYYAGAIFSQSGNPSISRCLFASNHGAFEAGAIDLESSSVDLIGCTFYGNYSLYGGAIYLVFADAVIKNSIFWNNQGYQQDIYLDFEGYVNIDYSDIAGQWGGTGNIEVDPLFLDPANDDFRLAPGSPCIDTGDPLSPNIPWGGYQIDMGAFEYDRGFYFDGRNLIRKPVPIFPGGVPSSP